ncbi:hypothetical protein BDF19DRAFT_248942 [Syncephalis fuscata]|nr:hypothetical protein BDF19DRAFT_248942 [Syncephalis fuscata]
MSFQTTNAPPNKWLLVEIIHRIALFSEGNAVAALSRTCTWLRACIVDYDNLWYHLYQYDFPLNMDQKINWIQWQLEEEHALSKLSNNKNSTNNSGINNRTWLQRYNQRNKLKSNWLRNRPTWTIDLLNTEEHTLAGVNFDEFSCISTCPGWAILANKIDHPVYLVELSAKKSHKIHKLEWRENKIDLFYSAAFIYDHQGRYGTKEYFKNTEQTKRGVFLAIHTYNDQYFPSKLQLWRVCNQELVRVISWDGGYSTRIVDSF